MIYNIDKVITTKTYHWGPNFKWELRSNRNIMINLNIVIVTFLSVCQKPQTSKHKAQIASVFPAFCYMRPCQSCTANHSVVGSNSIVL